MIENQKEFSKYRVFKNGNEIETEEALVHSQLEDEGDIEYSLGKIRIYAIGAAMAAVILIFILRVFYLQIVSGSSYRQEAIDNRIKRVLIEAPRGIIFSRDAEQLVWNNSVFDLAINSKLFPETEEERQKAADNILESLNFSDREKFKETAMESILKFDKNKSSSVVYKNIPRELVLSIETAPLKFPGLEILEGISRYYPKKDIISHILGYIGSASKEDLQDGIISGYVGKSGVEMQYDKTLRGIEGVQLIEVDSKGANKKYLASRLPESGKDIFLSLDFRLQEIVFNALSKKIQEIGAKKGAAIAINPKNGEILSLVSLPSFDNNIFSGSISKKEYSKIAGDKDNPLFNRAISGEYPPGSTIKPVMALAALEEKVISDRTIIQDNGVIRIANKYNPDVVYTYYGWQRAGLGPMDVYSAIAQSSDIFFYTAGGGDGNIGGLGIEKMDDYFYKFGLGEILRIDLPGESGGLVPTPEWKKKTKGEDWFLGNTYHVSIGQGDLLSTPLQVAMWTAAIANGGIAMRPHIILDAPKEIVFSLNADKKNIAIIQKAMRLSITDGSARALSSLSVEVAGKTGTAETGVKEVTHAWFTCFAPYKDPEIALTILIEEGGGGAAVAVPVAQEILEGWF